MDDVETLFNDIQRRKKGIIDSEDYNGVKDLILNQNSDTAHFVWELLQNAEDAKATSISFKLNKTELQIRHNGSKLFDKSNVEAICSIGASNKDENQIGKIGIGFKSVYNYTDAPQIYSGKYTFKIEELVYPLQIPKYENLGNDTLFILPFNDPEKAYKDIEKKLNELSTSSLLFLSSIEEINTDIDGKMRCIRKKVSDSESGILKQKPHLISDNVTFERISIEDTITKKEYYRFKLSEISLIDEIKKGEKRVINNQSVMIAYRLNSDGTILPISKSDDKYNDKYFVYFPTVIRTHLEYLVHAPFKTTPGREGIKEVEANDILYESIMRLVVYSLFYLIDRKEITHDFYNFILLPTKDTDSRILMPKLKDILHKALIHGIKILPASNGGYTSLQEILIEKYTTKEKGRLKKLFSVSEIASHISEYQQQKYWDSGFFSTELHNFIRTSKLYQQDKNEINFTSLLLELSANWLESKSVEDLKEIYELTRLTINNFEIRRTLIKEKLPYLPLIRKPDGKHVSAQSPGIYLRDSDIHSELWNDESCRSFIRDILKVKEYDRGEVIKDEILSKYTNADVSISLSANITDLRAILSDIDDNNIHCDEINKYKILSGINAGTGISKWCKPEELYLTEKTGGESNTEILLHGIESVYFLHPDYASFTNEYDENPLTKLGVHQKLEIISNGSNNKGKYGVSQIRNKVEIKRSNFYIFPKDGFRINICLPHLNEILETICPEKSLALFRLLSSSGRVIRERVDWNTNGQNSQVGSSLRGKEEIYSDLGVELHERAWLYGKDGNIFAPKTVSVDDLLDEYRDISEDLLERLGVSGAQPTRRRRALELIEDPDEREMLELYHSASHEKKQDIMKRLKKSSKPDPAQKFQSSSTTSGLNLRDSLLEHDKVSRNSNHSNKDEDEDEYDEVTRSPIKDLERHARKSEERIREGVSDKPARRVNLQAKDDNSEEKSFLKSEYPHGKCQICSKQIIGKNDGEPIFIAHKLTPGLDEKYKHANKTGWNSVCLCPNCDAELTHCENNVASSVLEAVESNSIDTTKPQISLPVRICGINKEICYTQRHILQFKIGLETLEKMHKNE
mgnify:CR=1 FL=1